jgi:hypothetical protein
MATQASMALGLHDRSRIVDIVAAVLGPGGKLFFNWFLSADYSRCMESGCTAREWLHSPAAKARRAAVQSPSVFTPQAWLHAVDIIASAFVEQDLGEHINLGKDSGLGYRRIVCLLQVVLNFHCCFCPACTTRLG